MGPRSVVGQRGDVRPGVGARRRRGGVLGNGGRRRAGARARNGRAMRTLVTGGARASSGPTSWIACSSRATKSTWSTTSRPGRCPTWLTPEAAPAGRSTIHHLDITAARRGRARWPAAAPSWCSTWPRRPTCGSQWPRPGLRRRRQHRGLAQRPGGRPPGRESSGSSSPPAVAPSTANPTADDLPVRESHPHHPLSPYGVAKKSVIDYLVAYPRCTPWSCPRWRSGNVYGPRQDPHGEAGVVSIFAERVLAGGQPVTIFGNGEQNRATSCSSTTSSTPWSAPPPGAAVSCATSPRGRRRR